MECHISLITNILELCIPTWTNFRSTKGQTKLCCRICTLSFHLHKVQNNTTQGLGIHIYVFKTQFLKHNLKHSSEVDETGAHYTEWSKPER